MIKIFKGPHITHTTLGGGGECVRNNILCTAVLVSPFRSILNLTQICHNIGWLYNLNHHLDTLFIPTIGEKKNPSTTTCFNLIIWSCNSFLSRYCFVILYVIALSLSPAFPSLFFSLSLLAFWLMLPDKRWEAQPVFDISPMPSRQLTARLFQYHPWLIHPEVVFFLYSKRLFVYQPVCVCVCVYPRGVRVVGAPKPLYSKEL